MKSSDWRSCIVTAIDFVGVKRLASSGLASSQMIRMRTYATAEINARLNTHSHGYIWNDSMPKISDSFRRGVISYSKVRAMTRIATPENEAALLNVAEHGTAVHVEKLVRKYHWVEALEDARRVNGTYYRRNLQFSHDEDGSLLLGAKLPPEVGTVVRKAIEAAVDVIEKDARRSDAATQRRSDDTRTQSNVSAETSGRNRTR